MKPEEIQKLSDHELLVKTYGKVQKIDGVLGNGGGLLGDVRLLKDNQKHFVTRKELVITVGIVSAIFAGFGVLIYFV